MKRKDLEHALHLKVLNIFGDDGYFVVDEYSLAKDVNDGVRWVVYITLSEISPLYAVSSRIACQYLNASVVMMDFIRENNVLAESLPMVMFGSALERYTKEGSVQRISEKSLTDTANELCKRIKEAEKAYLLPRIDQKFVVEEYLKKPSHKWPTSDLLQCCLTVVSYGLLNNSPSIMKSGMNRVFEILNKPNYSQLHRGFFESLNKAIEGKYADHDWF